MPHERVTILTSITIDSFYQLAFDLYANEIMIYVLLSIWFLLLNIFVRFISNVGYSCGLLILIAV